MADRCDTPTCTNPAAVRVVSLETHLPVYSCAGCLTAGWRAADALRDAVAIDREKEREDDAVGEVLSKSREFWSTSEAYELAERLRKEAGRG